MLRFGKQLVTWPSPSSSSADLFCDGTSRHVCIVCGDDNDTVVLKHMDGSELRCRIQNSRTIRAIRISPERGVACVQRSDSLSIVWLSGATGKYAVESPIKCKAKNCVVTQFEWFSTSGLVVVTDKSVETYQVVVEKKSVKFARSINVESSWSIFEPSTATLLLCHNKTISILQPIRVSASGLDKLSKITLATDTVHFQERDVAIFSLYAQPVVTVFIRKALIELQLFKITGDDQPAQRAPDFVLTMPRANSGPYGLQAVDNLLVIHDAATRETFVYDIEILDDRGQPMATLSAIDVTSALRAHIGDDPSKVGGFLQSSTLIAPDTVVSSQLRFATNLSTSFRASVPPIGDVERRICFLLNRRDARETALGELHDALKLRTLSMPAIARVFRRIVRIQSMKDCDRKTIDQQHLLSAVLIPLRDDVAMCKGRLANAMLRLLEVVHDEGQEATFVDQLAETMVAAGQAHRLHQLVSCRVVQDSKTFAYLLLELAAHHPPLQQAGVDMLARLRPSHAAPAIFEYLLDSGRIPEAVAFMDQQESTSRDALHSPVSRLLENAWTKSPRSTRHAVFVHMEARPPERRQCSAQHWAVYNSRFETLYSEDEEVRSLRDSDLNVILACDENGTAMRSTVADR